MCQRFVTKKEKTISIHFAKSLEDIKLTDAEKGWAAIQSNEGTPQIILLPTETGGLKKVLCVGGHVDMWMGATLSEKLPAQHAYHLEDYAGDLAHFAFAWGMAHYRFESYKTPAKKKTLPALFLPKEMEKEVMALLSATFLVRDLINTPACDLTPLALAEEAERVGKRFKAKTHIVRGADLEKAFPMVHAVGRASVHAPCIFDLSWGDPKNPTVTLIGKGVTFDTGGLDVKPPSNMLLMKKDMGGAAHALALAQLVMEMGLPVHLRLILPCAENAIGSNAYRPSDILKSRKGLTVEVSDTDAEGRLLLADALTAATENPADYTFDFATLTGAARVAVGTEIAAFFSNDAPTAKQLEASSVAQLDPVWALPLWQGYEGLLATPVADTKSCSAGGYGGAITAALFLEKFLEKKTKWVHFDLMGWNTRPRPGRPVGGEAMGLRAAYEFLKGL